MQTGDITREILRAWVGAALTEGPQFWHYGELARKIGRAGQGYEVSQALPELTAWCQAHDLPDIAVMIVSKDKKERGVMMPSDLALVKMGGPAAIRAGQARVLGFDWRGWAG